MNIFITGATGFIGGHLVKRLVQDGHNIVCLVRPNSNIVFLKALGVNFVSGDVTMKNNLAKGMLGCEFMINLANVYSFWEPDKRIYTQVNIEGTRNVMEAALESSVSKVVHVSTYGIYGKPVDCPFTENSQVVPLYTCEYTRTKYAGDLIAWDLYEKHGLPLVVVYPCNILGAGDTKTTGKYILDFIHKKLPATIFEDTVFTFVHINDVVETIVRVLNKPEDIGQKYIIGKYQLSMREINQLIHEISGAPIPKIKLPGFLASITAALCTAVSNFTKRPPPWGMCTDQIRSMKESIRADGSKVERELKINYTPIRVALEDAISSYQGQG